MKKLLSSVSVVILLAAAPAMALDLQSARASGAVVEQPTGYIKAANSAPETAALVQSER